MMGLRLADFAFRIAMGAILLGWLAYAYSLQAEHESFEREMAKNASSQEAAAGFVDDGGYDPSVIQPDPYSRVHDDTVPEHMAQDEFGSAGDDWGN
jgi:hypothetical protein